MTLHKMHRRDDPETSVAAAESVRPKLRQLQEVVLGEISDSGLKGLTDPELDRICKRKYGQRAQSTYRTRRAELVEKGLVAWTGNTINRHRVWALASHYPQNARTPRLSRDELERQYKRTNAWLERILRAADQANDARLYAEIEAVEKEMGR